MDQKIKKGSWVKGIKNERNDQYGMVMLFDKDDPKKPYFVYFFTSDGEKDSEEWMTAKSVEAVEASELPEKIKHIRYIGQFGSGDYDVFVNKETGNVTIGCQKTNMIELDRFINRIKKEVNYGGK